MDALVMCGGEGRRLDSDGEKPLFAIDRRPMIDSVLGALADSRIDAITAATSPAAPRTSEYLDEHEVPLQTIETAGDGYVADLREALDHVDRPVLTVVADLPLLDGEVVDRVLERFAASAASVAGGPDHSLTVCVPVSLKRTLGVSVDTTIERGDRTLAPTGLNVVAAGEAEAADETIVAWDARLAVNVNRPSDAAIAERLLGGSR